MIQDDLRNGEWVSALAEFLESEKEVGAIIVEAAHRPVSLATVGRVNTQALERKLQAVLRRLESKHPPGAPNPTSRPPGILVKHLPGETLIEKQTCATAPQFWTWREVDWPVLEDFGEHDTEEWKVLAIQAGLCGVALAAAFFGSLLGLLPGPVVIGLYLISLVAGAWDAAIDTVKNLSRGQVDIHFLMLAVAVGAVSIGAWAEGALLLFLFSASGAIEHFAFFRTHKEIHALVKSAPKVARLRRPDGSLASIPVEDIRAGDLLVVKADESFAVDGEVVEGESAANESNLTGEAAPVSKAVGDSVLSGTLNLWGSVVVRARRPASESSLQKIISLIEHAQHLKAPSQRFTDRFGRHYTLGVLIAVAVMFFVWWLVFGVPPFKDPDGGHSAFYRAMTLLVVASPCALVLSIPSAILAAIAWGARHGILFRGGAAIEQLATVRTIALDKTGTLTTGEPEVVAVESFPIGSEDEILALALALEANSNHPLGRAITAYGRRLGIEQKEAQKFQSLTGLGLRGKVDGQTVFLGRRELIGSGGLSTVMEALPEPGLGTTEVWVVHEKLIGRILLKDEVRSESSAVLRELAGKGIRTVMLTGDRRGAAERVAESLGISEVRSGLHPEDKVRAIRELCETGPPVAMVGDGVNDAPCLAAADVAIAMGGRGSDAALEQSDVVLMQDRIERLLTALHLSESARRIIKQNLTVSLGTVILMVSASLFGIVPLPLGVIAHEGSTLVVCLNSLRLLFIKEKPGTTHTSGA